MAPLELEVDRWAEQQFGECDLGDARRTRRLLQVAAQVAADPAASTPDQIEKWSDLKAAYRLFDKEDVTFASVAAPHWQQSRQQTSGTWLVLGDTTEIDFGYLRDVEGLAAVGKGTGRGFLLHSGLLVHPDSEEVVGLAGQAIRYRRQAPRPESSLRKLQRDRESLVWGELIDEIGAPPVGVRFIHVFDRGAHHFEVFCRLLQAHDDWVVRAGHLERALGPGPSLQEFAERLPVAGTYELSLRATAGQRARRARLQVRFDQILIPAPRQRSPWLRAIGIETIAMWFVHVEEVDAPRGVEPLRWALLTSLPVESFDDAWRVIGYYEKRPLIEEFHKALKTGCQLETRQYQTSERLEPLTALLSIVAVRLLQLRSRARSEPERPAEQVVPKRWISVLASLRRGRKIVTVRQFYRELAGFGGFLGRKHDGEPGWITLWRGFEKLQLCVRAVRAHEQKCG